MGSLVTMPKLPTIDFTKGDLTPGSSSWLSTSNDVRLALEEYGCFVAVSDKVSSKFYNTILSNAEELFELPTEVKQKNINEIPYTGYVGQNPMIPLHEGLGIDDATKLESAQSFTNLMFPEGNEHFSENMHSLSKIIEELDQMVIKMVFDSYGVEKYYQFQVESVTYVLKLLKYRVPLENETRIGLQPHEDKSFTTVIYENGAKGLEMETKNGEWVAFEPNLTSFLFLAGDALLAWSNGRIHSPKHRVVMGEEKMVRYSFVQFNFNKGIIEPPHELVDDDHPLQFKPFNHVGIIHFYGTEEARSAKSIVRAYCGV